jgi:Asp-tRNA(Asn)/Glu-tRNA(Gln) amidotransferase A subunit family amidase
VDTGELKHALASRSAMIAVACDWLDNFDALLVPSAPAGAPEGLKATGDPSCCTLASLLGAPAVSLPAGRDARGLPLGLQLVTAPGTDAELLRVALWCEKNLPFTGLV